ncbi:hypothetical protein Ancab_035004 [Ancistrocladus abbreviatus]
MAEDGVLQPTLNKWKMPIFVFFNNARLVFKMDELGLEILRIAFPAALALAADPIASLIDTAFIGHIGPVELAAVGVSIAIFNQASRITIFPLVSITTSFVAEEDTVRKVGIEPLDNEHIEKGSAKSGISKEFTAEGDLLEDLENGSATESDKEDKEPEKGFQAVTCKTESITSSIPKMDKVGKREAAYSFSFYSTCHWWGAWPSPSNFPYFRC